ncbi:nuclear transport factor 2 family protein [Mucilaginibacter sp.]|jgi:ketosteroid isomerase-like protein|uniref:nuclear transport factor 2 family protein n=1 Tax=Mucilaginibacter sp. TaxID=1882438 RepID=UPI00356344E5
MNLPAVVAALVEAQNNLDHSAYADCFDEAAIVYDEGETHNGKAEIRKWIEQANKKYQTRMEPLSFTQIGDDTVLEARVSGTFDGSPLVLKYHLELVGGLIQSLKVTG